MKKALQNALVLLAALSAMTGVASAAPSSEVLFEGTWIRGGYTIEGRWRIVLEEDGRRYVVLDENFRTRRAPDLKIFLSPLPLEEIGDRNATKGAVLVAPLERHRGFSRYAIKEEVDLEPLRTIIVHCEEFSKFWAGSDLNRPEPDYNLDNEPGRTDGS